MKDDEPWTETLQVGLDSRSSEPAAPTSIPKYIAEGLQKQGAETLRTIAEYSLELALYLEVKTQRELEQQAESETLREPPDDWESSDEKWEETVRDVREDKDLPTKAYRTIKTIDGRDYVYAQWREGDTVTSEYICPVVPADSDS